MDELLTFLNKHKGRCVMAYDEQKGGMLVSIEALYPSVCEGGPKNHVFCSFIVGNGQAHCVTPSYVTPSIRTMEKHLVEAGVIDGHEPEALPRPTLASLSPSRN